MKLSKTVKKGLIYPILGVFLAVLGLPSPIYGMQRAPRVIHIAMNSYVAEYVQKKDQYKIWTDKLCGCVTTIIDIEYTNGNHALCMGHFAYDAKDQNKLMIENFLSAQISQQRNTIKKASCTLIPPGIYSDLPANSSAISPILDPAWKEMLIASIKRHIPAADITITPYLFNKLLSQVHYAYNAGKTSLEIVNLSSKMDEENKDSLLETHHYETQNTRCKAAVVTLIMAGVVGLALYSFTF